MHRKINIKNNVRVSVSADMCVGVDSCVCMWRAEEDFGCSPIPLRQGLPLNLGLTGNWQSLKAP